jgi:hypothetical protein
MAARDIITFPVFMVIIQVPLAHPSFFQKTGKGCPLSL